MKRWMIGLLTAAAIVGGGVFMPGQAVAATEQILLASFNNEAAQLWLRFDTTSRQIDAAICVITAGTMEVTLEKKNGQVRSFTCTVGTTEITNIPGNLQMEIEPESGLWTTTSPGGNLIMRTQYAPPAQ